MPPLTRWMIKTSLVYLVLALLTGLLLALQPLLNLDFLSSGLLPAYLHLYMIGWVSLLIFGIGFWMFPKYSLARPRRSERLGWIVYGLINAGLLLRVPAELLVRPGSSWAWVLVISALLLWLGGLGFVLNTWQRIKEK